GDGSSAFLAVLSAGLALFGGAALFGGFVVVGVVGSHGGAAPSVLSSWWGRHPGMLVPGVVSALCPRVSQRAGIPLHGMRENSDCRWCGRGKLSLVGWAPPTIFDKWTDDQTPRMVSADHL